MLKRLYVRFLLWALFPVLKPVREGNEAHKAQVLLDDAAIQSTNGGWALRKYGRILITDASGAVRVNLPLV